MSICMYTYYLLQLSIESGWIAFFLDPRKFFYNQCDIFCDKSEPEDINNFTYYITQVGNDKYILNFTTSDHAAPRRNTNR